MTSVWQMIKDLFHLSDDTDRVGAIKNIGEGIEFRGNNVWSLIIAILIASIGLNLNSPAVIIGAMLISPLMGPILGAGTALGIFDSQLLKRSLINLLIMTIISLGTSTIYFSITPLTGATSEILARTAPTFFDVLIASLGGTALIIGITRKSRSTNLLAGVAIATALMPPLCTAGFGIATRNLNYFLGAFYLYMINSIFIGAAAFIFSKYLKLDPMVAPEQKSKHPLMIYLIGALVFITPSVFMAYDLVQDSDFRAKADHYVENNLVFDGTQVLSVQKTRKNQHNEILVVLAGKVLSTEIIDHLKSQLPSAGLNNTDLKIIQGDESGAMIPGQDSLSKTDTSVQISKLKEELQHYTNKMTIIADLTKEIPLLFPELINISFGELELRGISSQKNSKKLTFMTYWNVKPSAEEQSRFTLWLKLRLQTEDLEVLFLEHKSSSSHE